MKQLFCDCKTDEEKSNFFLSGRAVESGVIAPALVNDVAMAYHRCAEFKKETDALRAELLEKLASANRAVEEAYQRGYATGQEEIEAERDALRAKITEMEEQEPAGTLHDDGYFVWRKRPHPHQSNYAGWKMALYALPGAQAQPASSVPREAIDKMLTQLMDIAVSNGANSVSMPDEYVEVAAWLCGIPAQPAPSFADAYQGAMEEVAIWKKRALEAEDLNRKFVAEINGPTYMGEPAQPAPSVPDGWKLVPIEPTPMMLRALIDGANQYDSWNEGYRDMLSAAPEAKP